MGLLESLCVCLEILQPTVERDCPKGNLAVHRKDACDRSLAKEMIHVEAVLLASEGTPVKRDVAPAARRTGVRLHTSICLMRSAWRPP